MSLLNTGLTGILSNQKALETTSNNITNANTPGYSRQRADFESNPSQATGSGYIGQGVNIVDIQRLNDQFINTQLRSDTTLHSEQKALVENLNGMDDLLGNEDTGLNRALTDFFGTLQDAAESPASSSLREQALSQADNLVARFQSVDSQLRAREETVNDRISANIGEINSLADGIAELNKSIAEAPGRASGRDANELLDKRDEKLRKLSELVQVQTNENDDGTVNVRIGKGQGMVSKGNSATLRLAGPTEQAGRREVMLEGLGEDRAITHELTGGALGGNLKFRDEIIEPTMNGIGRIAIGLSQRINEQHKMGQDLNGNLGGNFFRNINADTVAKGRITPSADTAQGGSPDARVEITDSSQLDTRSYTLEITDASGGYNLRDAASGEVVKNGSVDPDPPPIQTIGYNGFEIQLESGSLQEGDEFSVRPTYNGARDMETEISSGEDIALAAPIRAESNSGNQGTGQISQGKMLESDPPGLDSNGNVDPPLQIRFTSESQYEVNDVSDPANPTTLTTGTFEPGKTNTVFSADPADPNYRGFQFELSGNPEKGDSFRIEANEGGTSDNRNGLALGDLNAKNYLDDGNFSFTDAYGAVVEDVGSRTRTAQVDKEAAGTLKEQSQKQWEEQSGVNLDEEAGKLVQFQNAYSASSQVVSVARDLFNTLIGTFN
ncbi:flagellar hook-associated protein FlgK [Halomonadaceae bacterium KBTZ08]